MRLTSLPRRFEQAYLLADRSADMPAMAEAALGLGGLWVREQRTLTGAVQLEARLQHVLPLPDDGSPLALRVRVRLPGEAYYARGESSAILAVLDEARAAGDPALLAGPRSWPGSPRCRSPAAPMAVRHHPCARPRVGQQRRRRLRCMASFPACSNLEDDAAL